MSLPKAGGAYINNGNRNSDAATIVFLYISDSVLNLINMVFMFASNLENILSGK